MANRRIFEEVESRPGRKPPIQPTSEPAGNGRRRIQAWLIILFALTVLTVLVGGMTRLTDSGLSITEWKPVTGVMPPFSEAHWQSEFEKYSRTTEFKMQNSGMSISEFKTIYWWEWSHRQLGRLVGLAWIAGFAWFAVRGELTGRRIRRLLAVGGLIGVQGAVGWWMVASGLSGEALDVAPYRLAVHLGLAFAVTGIVFWEILLLGRRQHELLQARRSREARLERAAGWLTGLIGLQLLAGAIVAGNDAGQGFPTWPLMNGEFFPSSSFNLDPWISNFVNNSSLAQFNHRILGYAAAAAAAVFWWQSRSSGTRSTKSAFSWVFGLAAAQTVIGIATALTAASPQIAILHQFGAVALFHASLWARFESRYPRLAVR